MEGEAQVVVFLGTEVVAHMDRKAGAEGMAQVGRAPEEVVAHPPEKLKGGKGAKRPILEKKGAKVASRWLSHGKSKCGFPRGTRHQHECERDDFGKNASG